MKRFEIFFGIIKVPVDFFMTIFAFLVAYELRLITEPIKGFSKPIDYTILPTLTEYLEFSVFAAAALVVVFTFGKLYILKSTLRLTAEAKKVIVLCFVWSMLMITYFYFTRTFPFSRLAMAYSWALTMVFIVVGRTLVRLVETGILASGIGKRNIVFIGKTNVAKEIAHKMNKNSSYRILGTVSNLKSLKEKFEIHHIDEVVQTKNNVSEEAREIIEFCEYNHVGYRFIPDQMDFRRTNVSIETISGIPIITLNPTALDGWGKVYKRMLDILGATVGLILLSPVLIITSIAIKLDSRGPIIFSKLENGSPVKRVGQRGKNFRFYKFRSMKHNSHSERYTTLAKNNTRTEGPLVKIKNDPRVTPVGRFIRRYSIDELPQLWSVLKGDMSLVGPRPHLPEEVAKYKKHHRFVLTIKPGVTGLAQVSGRSDLSFEEEVRLDRYYIENWSLFFDLRIILRTVGVVLRGHKE